jgi:hypothetical protein
MFIYFIFALFIAQLMTASLKPIQIADEHGFQYKKRLFKSPWEPGVGYKFWLIINAWDISNLMINLRGKELAKIP